MMSITSPKKCNNDSHSNTYIRSLSIWFHYSTPPTPATWKECTFMWRSQQQIFEVKNFYFKTNIKYLLSLLLFFFFNQQIMFDLTTALHKPTLFGRIVEYILRWSRSMNERKRYYGNEQIKGCVITKNGTDNSNIHLGNKEYTLKS